MIGIAETRKVDRAAGKVVVVRTQDAEPFIRQAKAFRDEANRKFTRQKSTKQAAMIPFVVLEAWIKSRGMQFSDFISDRSAVKKMLNDPDFKKLRVWEGRL